MNTKIFVVFLCIVGLLGSIFFGIDVVFKSKITATLQGYGIEWNNLSSSWMHGTLTAEHVTIPGKGTIEYLTLRTTPLNYLRMALFKRFPSFLSVKAENVYGNFPTGNLESTGFTIKQYFLNDNKMMDIQLYANSVRGIDVIMMATMMQQDNPFNLVLRKGYIDVNNCTSYRDILQQEEYLEAFIHYLNISLENQHNMDCLQNFLIDPQHFHIDFSFKDGINIDTLKQTPINEINMLADLKYTLNDCHLQ